MRLSHTLAICPYYVRVWVASSYKMEGEVAAGYARLRDACHAGATTCMVQCLYVPLMYRCIVQLCTTRSRELCEKMNSSKSSAEASSCSRSKIEE